MLESSMKESLCSVSPGPVINCFTNLLHVTVSYHLSVVPQEFIKSHLNALS